MFRLFVPPRAAAAGVLIGLAASVADAQPAGVSPAVVKILSCVVTSPGPLSRHPTGTLIAYVNTGPTVLHRVTFVLGYHTSDGIVRRSVEDVGIFAPDTPVKHHFDTYKDVTFAGHKPASCTVAEVR